MDGLPDSYRIIVEDCIERNMTKEETTRHVRNEYRIPLEHANRVWNHLESTNRDLFTAYNARMRERNARMRDRSARIPPRVAPRSTPEVTSSARTPKLRGIKKEHPLSPPHAARGPLLPDLNVRLASPQKATAYATAGPSRAANALENEKLQASQQQPAYPNDFWQQILSTMGQIQSTLGHIQSNTDQMVKLFTDGHGFGLLPQPSAARSSKRQRVGEVEERGKNEKGEKLHEKDEGNDIEAEKQQKKEEGDDNEAEKVQENERGGDEETEKVQERGDNEEVQEKEEGNDGEAAEKMQD